MVFFILQLFSHLVIYLTNICRTLCRMLSSGLWGYKESEQERQSSKVDILVGGVGVERWGWEVGGLGDKDGQ